ncbi:MAG: hypothetical protein ACLSE8_09200 [Parasutterella sp.]
MYSNMVQQYNTAVNTLQNFTGTRGLGLVDYNLNLRNLIPKCRPQSAERNHERDIFPQQFG